MHCVSVHMTSSYLDLVHSSDLVMKAGAFFFRFYRTPVSSAALLRSTFDAIDIRTHMHVCFGRNFPTHPLRHEKAHMHAHRPSSLNPVSSDALRRSTCGATDKRTHMHVCSDKNSPTHPLQHEQTHAFALGEHAADNYGTSRLRFKTSEINEVL